MRSGGNSVLVLHSMVSLCNVVACCTSMKGCLKGMVFRNGCVCRRMRTGWVTPSVAVVVGVAVTFGSVAGSENWGFCEGDLVVVSVDRSLGGSFEACASFVESIVECVYFV